MRRSRTASRSASLPTPEAEQDETIAIPRRGVTKRPVAKAPKSSRRAPANNVSHTMALRLAERRRAQRRRRWRNAGFTLASLAVTAGLVWLVVFSGVFSLRPEKVRIEGASSVVAVGEIEQLAASHAGQSLALLNTGELRDQVRAVSGVKDVSIRRAWPAGLHLDLTPRQVVAAIPGESGYAMVDAEGVELARASEPGDDVPLIEIDLGDSAALTATLAIWDQMPNQLRTDVRIFTVASRDDIRTTLHSGQVVRWGSDAEFGLKLAAVETLRMVDPKSRVFDVSAPALPVTR